MDRAAGALRGVPRRPAAGREGNFAPLRPVLPDGLRLALLPQLLDALAPAGDTALLLADYADSRALLAAQVLARRFRHLRLETGAGQEALERQLLRQLGLTTGGGPAAVTVTFGPPPREGLPLYLTPDCALRQEVRYAWPDPSQTPPPEGLLSLLHRPAACRRSASNPWKPLTSVHKITIMQRDIL